MEITLLENAFDYILDAVQQLQGKRPSKKRIKYGIVHLWSGIELLLKKRLMDEHWSLIFRDVNKADIKALESGDFWGRGRTKVTYSYYNINIQKYLNSAP